MTRRRMIIAGSVAVTVLGLTAVTVVVQSGGSTAAARWTAAAGGLPAASSPADIPVAPPSAARSSAAPSASPDCGPWSCEQQRRFTAAATFVKSKPGYLGVIIRHRQTCAVWRTGTPDHVM